MKIKVYNFKKQIMSNVIPEMSYFFGENMKGYRDGIYIYSEPVDNFLWRRNLLLCCCIKLKFGEDVYNTILTDSNFRKLPKIVQRALIEHEIGHVVNKDIEDLSESEANKLVIQRLFGFLPEMEVKADAYAASVIGHSKMIEAFKFMVKNTNLPFNTKIEIIRRIFKLKKSARV